MPPTCRVALRFQQLVPLLTLIGVGFALYSLVLSVRHNWWGLTLADGIILGVAACSNLFYYVTRHALRRVP